MPELPEVESVRRALAPAMVGARFEDVTVRRANLRIAFPDRFVERIKGQRLDALTRRAKYLLGHLSSGETLLIHLGMSGSFRLASAADDGSESEAGVVQPHDHVVFQMSSGWTVIFNDPRRFGLMDLVPAGALASHPALRTLGPEPLSAELDAAALARACRGRRTSLKVALLDQRVVAGLGNIYVSEALNRARLSPTRLASTIATPAGAPRDSAIRLVAAIKKVLEDAVASASATPDGIVWPDRFRAYDREGARCKNRGCPGRIRRRVQAGRSTFYCPTCQK